MSSTPHHRRDPQQGEDPNPESTDKTDAESGRADPPAAAPVEPTTHSPAGPGPAHGSERVADDAPEATLHVPAARPASPAPSDPVAAEPEATILVANAGVDAPQQAPGEPAAIESTVYAAPPAGTRSAPPRAAAEPTIAAPAVADEGTRVVSPATVEPAAEAEEEPAFHHPEHIGPFRIVKLLGEGGMGAVYLAEQSEPVRRQVAIKLVHASLRSPMAIARFTAERQAMARLSHQNVAQLYEAGTTEDGFPYFAMEYLPGESLIDYCDRHSLGLRERIAMFVRICQGVLHAHQKGLLHRDLKPGNLLISEAGGQAVPKVIDFGIAKALDDPLTEEPELTGVGGIIGTPSYMSPEALAANPDLDIRTDVYSLGIVLYELLAGVGPREIGGRALAMLIANGVRPELKRFSTRLTGVSAEKAREIAAQRGLAAGQLKERLRGDLDWIVMKAIAEERELRYDSVAELAADLDRYLKDEPIEARPPSFRYRAGKMIRRHRAAVAAAAIVLLALVLGIVGTSVGMLRAAREAEAARQVSAFLTRIFEVSDPGEARGNSVTARELLDQGARRIRSELKDQPLVQARLMRTMGGVYENLGLYKQAEPLERAALEVRRKTLGDDSPEVGRSLDALGAVYNKQGHYREAEGLQRKAVAVLEKTVGPGSPDLAEALMQLGLTCFLLDKRTEAETLYRRALAIREAALGPNSPDVAANLAHLGYLLSNEQRYKEAEVYLARALKIRESTLGEDHFLVAVSLDLLADAYSLEGRYAEAEPLYLRSLKIKQKVLAPDHPNVAESYFALGRIYVAEDRNDKAEASLRSGIEIDEKTLGPNHVNLSRGLQPLGMLLANEGKWQDAEVVFRRLVHVYETAVGPNHKWVGQALNNLGWVLSDGLHDYAAAETVLRRAVAIFPLDKDPGYDGALARWSLANCLRDAKRYDDAEPVYAEALKILEASGDAQGKSKSQLPDFIADYAKSLRAAGRDADAVALEARVKR